MKLNELKNVLFSRVGDIQSVIIYSRTEHKEIKNGCRQNTLLKIMEKKNCYEFRLLIIVLY